MRLRAEPRNHAWSYDFVEDWTHEGKKYRRLNVIDEFTHEPLAIRIDRKMKPIDVIDALSNLFILQLAHLIRRKSLSESAIYPFAESDYLFANVFTRQRVSSSSTPYSSDCGTQVSSL